MNYQLNDFCELVIIPLINDPNYRKLTYHWPHLNYFWPQKFKILNWLLTPFELLLTPIVDLYWPLTDPHYWPGTLILPRFFFIKKRKRNFWFWFLIWVFEKTHPVFPRSFPLQNSKQKFWFWFVIFCAENLNSKHSSLKNQLHHVFWKKTQIKNQNQKT